MVLNHTNSGAQPHQSRYRAMVLTRTTGGAHRSQYSLRSLIQSSTDQSYLNPGPKAPFIR